MKISIIIPDKNKTAQTKKEFVLTEPGEQLFIGPLVENIPFDPTIPDRYCLDDNNLWIGSSFRLGRLNLFSQKVIPETLIGKTVAVSGIKKKSLDDKITLQGPCTEKNEILQFRDDWFCDEGGSFTSRKQLASVEYIEMTDIAEIDLITSPPPFPLPRKGKSSRKKRGTVDSPSVDSVEIVIQNSTSISLENLNLVIHYEGGARKSSALYKSAKLSLSPGESKTVKYPCLIEEEWRKDEYSYWYYHSAYVIDTMGPIEFLGPPNFKIDQELLNR